MHKLKIKRFEIKQVASCFKLSLSIFFPLIIIYLLLLSSIRKKKLNTSEAALYLFVGFLTIVASVILVTEVSLFLRILIVLVVGIACIVVAILFYHFTKPKKQLTTFKPITSVPTKWQRFKHSFMLSFAVFESIGLIVQAVLIWQTLTFFGVPIVTYYNLFSISEIIVGLLIMWRVLWRYYKSSEEERRNFF